METYALEKLGVDKAQVLQRRLKFSLLPQPKPISRLTTIAPLDDFRLLLDVETDATDDDVRRAILKDEWAVLLINGPSTIIDYIWKEPPPSIATDEVSLITYLLLPNFRNCSLLYVCPVGLFSLD
jgi:hypothetical protein